MNIYESAEDYLEMILRLHKTKGYARAVDIANGLSVSKPSVSIAIQPCQCGKQWQLLLTLHHGEHDVVMRGVRLSDDAGMIHGRPSLEIVTDHQPVSF